MSFDSEKAAAIFTEKRMPRPKNKTELLDQSHSSYRQLVSLIDNYSKEEQQLAFLGNSLNRNIRDVLAHLDHWHRMLLEWYKVGMGGEKPEMPAPGHSWKTVPQLNVEINEKYKDVDIETVRASFFESYQMVHECIVSHTDDELFTKKKYKWTGSTSMGSYFISATYSHYQWAIKFVRKNMKLALAESP